MAIKGYYGLVVIWRWLTIAIIRVITVLLSQRVVLPFPMETRATILPIILVVRPEVAPITQHSFVQAAVLCPMPLSAMWLLWRVLTPPEFFPGAM